MNPVIPIVMFLLSTSVAFAHGGEDNDTPAPVATTSQGPRIEIRSDQFELLGALQDDHLTLYLDRYASNEPIAGAKIEVEGAGVKAVATAAGNGVYSVPADALTKPGKHPLIFTVQAGDIADLLNGELTVAGGAPAHGSGGDWLANCSIAGGAIATVILLVGFLLWRRRVSVIFGAQK